MQKFFTVLFLYIGLLVFCAPCFAHASNQKHDYWVELAGQRYTVELATNDAERAQGLMYRHRLLPHHGMFFIHDREQPLAYWMKNCFIPLDILFFDSHLRLVGQQRSVPPCASGENCPAYPSDAPARYVLEIPAGQAARWHIASGAVLKVSPDIHLPSDAP